ncbi:MAG: signal recognition particle-docking protein FtsY [Anaerolineae bacterium]|nr:signal recognition particle-docking protein FtsY [Anaerolineae bacterium]
MTNQIERWKSGLEKTRKSTFGRLAGLFGVGEINPDTWDQMEGLLIQADLGVEISLQIVEELKAKTQDEGWTKSEELRAGLREALRARLISPPEITFNPDELNVILVVGVNGSGKTTTVAKLGGHFKEQGYTVLLAAADTFRAAAIDQIQNWGERLGLRVIAGQPEGDPGAVTFDALQSAIAKKDDLLIIDTAGRLHTRFNLMEELKKIRRVAEKAVAGAPHAVWLVMDATTGQNGLQQAKAFKEAVGVTGIILAKLDSSARGGIAFAIQHELGLPILFAGLGEQVEDLAVFNPERFIDSILADFG